MQIKIGLHFGDQMLEPYYGILFYKCMIYFDIPLCFENVHDWN
jgi:hypothetical protein